MTSPFNKFDDFSKQLVAGTHDWDAHTFKVALTNTLPSASDISLDTVTAHPDPLNANGYVTGGEPTTISVVDVGGVTTVKGTAAIFTASGGEIGPFRYVILYNHSSSSPVDALVGWFDYNSSISLNDTESLTILFNSADPGTIFTLT